MTFEPHFTITAAILDNIMKITEGITRIGYAGPVTPRLRRTNRLRSLQSSLAIEGNRLSLDEVTAVIDGKEIKGPQRDIREITNARTAYDMIGSLDPYSVDDLLKAHGKMMDGLVKNPGKFRGCDVGVFDGEGNCVHLAPNPILVPGLMDGLIQWTKESDYPLILKSCVFHYEFENIHPFEDGNGRMGRLWQTLLLSKYDSTFEWIPVESMIRSHQNEYYDALAESDSSCDCTKFVEFITMMIAEALNESIEERLRESNDVEDEMTINEIRLFSMIRDGHFRNIGQAAEMMRVSIPTVNRCLRSLKDSEAIKKVGNKKTGKWVVITHETMIDFTDSEAE